MPWPNQPYYSCLGSNRAEAIDALFGSESGMDVVIVMLAEHINDRVIAGTKKADHVDTPVFVVLPDG